MNRGLPVIAIDGPAASGKGTLARALAGTLNFAHLDTGAIYRIAALYLVQQKIVFSDDAAIQAANFVRDNLTPERAQDPALRQDVVGSIASLVSAVPQVRDILLDSQRRFAAAPPHGFDGAVLDGRDIGTVVCPDADIKFFVTADLSIRARRRYEEFREKGIEVALSAVEADMQIRDARDSERAIAPLRPAPDAVLIDTSDLSARQALDFALAACRDALASA